MPSWESQLQKSNSHALVLGDHWLQKKVMFFDCDRQARTVVVDCKGEVSFIFRRNQFFIALRHVPGSFLESFFVTSRCQLVPKAAYGGLEIPFKKTHVKRVRA